MTNSLRVRLFLVLLGATSAIWLAAVVWIYASSRHEVEHVLDTRLQEAARMVASLVESLDSGPRGGAVAKAFDPSRIGPYERQLSCQIWSLDGRMIAKSSGAPDRSLTDEKSGFSEREIDNEMWRVFAVVDEVKGVRVLVGDRLGLRERLVADLIKGLLWPALLIAPMLGFMIWISVNRGLQPLHSLTRNLSARNADDMSPADVGHAPSEVRPLVGALNDLFRKVQTAREHERELTAFAAHELRTPLAGLKAQAQVALAADDPDVVRKALHQIVSAVDRSTRLVRQLLTIARLDALAEHGARERVDVGRLIADVVQATRAPSNIRVTIDEGLRKVTWNSNRECLELAIRNLHENAVQHMRDGGDVKWRASESGKEIFVEDCGPGIPEEELNKIGTRFFRGQFKSKNGSGLGVAIVHLASKHAGVVLVLRNRRDRSGLTASLQLQEPGDDAH